jgi:hypothetical protein
MRGSAAMAYSPKPVYELRLKVQSSMNWSLSIYQLPSPATPRLKEPEHVGTLQGAALRLVEMRVLKRLLKEKIQLGALKPGKLADGRWRKRRRCIWGCCSGRWPR